MIGSIKSKVASQAGGIVRPAAQQVFQEPWEVLKTGVAQVAGTEKATTQPVPQGPSQNQTGPTAQDIETLRRQDEVWAREQSEKLKSEIKLISDKNAQEKAARLAPPPEAEQLEGRNVRTFQEPTPKRSRRIFGLKAEIKRKQTRVENVPSTTT